VLGKALRVVYLLMNYAVVLVHKVELNVNSEIGAGFRISHAACIFIGPCRIGDNCTVTHNVTIGLGLTEARAGLPVIGHNVWIGTGSVVAGNITIGDGVTISAGSIVTRSIPPKCLVAGNPARVVSRDYDNTHMIVYRMNDLPALPSDSERNEMQSGSRPSGGVSPGCVIDDPRIQHSLRAGVCLQKE